MIVNLIRNSIQAAPRGVHIIVSTGRLDSTARLVVRDTGPGIPAEQLAQIFDPFYTTRQGRGGTGLGLSICHTIITEHGGTIAADSKPGKGATFTITLPLA